MALKVASLLVLLADVSAGCSFVLDPDELTAETKLEDERSETVTEVEEVTETDTVDTIDADELLGDADGNEAAPGKHVVVEHSGMISCTFDYGRDLAQCPVPCAPGWTYVVDASKSTGVVSFSWTFEATGGYTVEPGGATGARVELSIGAPECLIGGADMPSFSIIARLSTNGERAELIDLPTIAAAFTLSCGGEGACPDP